MAQQLQATHLVIDYTFTIVGMGAFQCSFIANGIVSAQYNVIIKKETGIKGIWEPVGASVFEGEPTLGIAFGAFADFLKQKGINQKFN